MRYTLCAILFSVGIVVMLCIAPSPTFLFEDTPAVGQIVVQKETEHTQLVAFRKITMPEGKERQIYRAFTYTKTSKPALMEHCEALRKNGKNVRSISYPDWNTAIIVFN